MRKALGLLAIFLVITQICSKSLAKSAKQVQEDTLNKMYEDWQKAYVAKREMEVVAVDSTPEVEDEDQLRYKNAIFDRIVNMGADENQKKLVNGRQPEPTGNELGSHEGSSLISLTRKFPKTDDPQFFFGNSTFTPNIYLIPQAGQIKRTPWSSTYWATKYGGISVRYSPSRNSQKGNWRTSVSAYSQPAEFRANSRFGNIASQVNGYYSPAEKYDVSVGDTMFTMTNYAKNEGYQYARTSGDVPSWYGICHGWCPASYIFPRPVRPVSVKSAFGITVRFLPDDLKALASQYFATVKYTTRWIGQRCQSAQGSARWSRDATCRSLNPGSFLVAIGNWMGINGKGATIDPKADPEIWNQPLKSYSLRYYNIRTNQFYASPKSAMIPVSQLRYCGSSWCRSAYAGAQSSGAAYVVGAFMRVTYVVETNPVYASYSKPDALKTGNFDSFIELDEDGNVIGGDWRYRDYPNFMWRPDEDMPILGVSDEAITSFTGTREDAQQLTVHARTASKKGQVLKSWIDFMLNQASS
jgi:hypothetical protein